MTYKNQVASKVTADVKTKQGSYDWVFSAELIDWYKGSGTKNRERYSRSRFK